MISKRIFSIALTWLAAMSMHAGTYTLKLFIQRKEQS